MFLFSISDKKDGMREILGRAHAFVEENAFSAKFEARMSHSNWSLFIKQTSLYL